LWLCQTCSGNQSAISFLGTVLWSEAIKELKVNTSDTRRRWRLPVRGDGSVPDQLRRAVQLWMMLMSRWNSKALVEIPRGLHVTSIGKHVECDDQALIPSPVEIFFFVFMQNIDESGGEIPLESTLERCVIRQLLLDQNCIVSRGIQHSVLAEEARPLDSSRLNRLICRFRRKVASPSRELHPLRPCAVRAITCSLHLLS